MWQKSKELEKLNEKLKKLEEKYIDECKQEEKNALHVSIAPKDQLLDHIDYVFVTFKSNQTPAKVKELFVIEKTSSKILRRIFCIDDDIKDNIELEDKALEVLPTVDPD
jgi:ketopantoate reductase